MAPQTQHLFVRPKFRALSETTKLGDAKESITSLPDLIEFNAEHNPDHVFCFQASVSHDPGIPGNPGSAAFNGRSITFGELSRSVAACAAWLSGSCGLDDRAEPKPLALYLESDVGLFFHLSALLTLDVPVRLTSLLLSGCYKIVCPGSTC